MDNIDFLLRDLYKKIKNYDLSDAEISAMKAGYENNYQQLIKDVYEKIGNGSQLATKDLVAMMDSYDIEYGRLPIADYVANLESTTNYYGYNSGGNGLGAVGKYQIRYKIHKPKIEKITGISNRDDFYNSKAAQEMYFEHIVVDEYLNHLPDLQQINVDKNLGYTDEELLYIEHHEGFGGAKRFLNTGTSMFGSEAVIKQQVTRGRNYKQKHELTTEDLFGISPEIAYNDPNNRAIDSSKINPTSIDTLEASNTNISTPDISKTPEDMPLDTSDVSVWGTDALLKPQQQDGSQTMNVPKMPEDMPLDTSGVSVWGTDALLKPQQQDGSQTSSNTHIVFAEGLENVLTKDELDDIYAKQTGNDPAAGYVAFVSQHYQLPGAPARDRYDVSFNGKPAITVLSQNASRASHVDAALGRITAEVGSTLVQTGATLLGILADVVEGLAGQGFSFDKYHDYSENEIMKDIRKWGTVTMADSEERKQHLELMKQAEEDKDVGMQAMLYLESLNDPEFWAEQGGQLVGSGLAFMLPGAFLSKVKMGTGFVNLLGKVLPKHFAKLIGAHLVGATVNSALESGQISGMHFDELLDAQLAQGVDEKTARDNASKSASESFGLNFAPLLVSNIIELSVITGKFSSGLGMNRFLKTLGTNFIAEGGQELYQFGTEQYSKRALEDGYDFANTGVFAHPINGFGGSIYAAVQGFLGANQEAIGSLMGGGLMGGTFALPGAAKSTYDYYKVEKPLAKNIRSILAESPDEFYKHDENGRILYENGKPVIDGDKYFSHVRTLTELQYNEDAISVADKLDNSDAVKFLTANKLSVLLYSQLAKGRSLDAITNAMEQAVTKKSFRGTDISRHMSYDEYDAFRKNVIETTKAYYDSIFEDTFLKKQSNTYKERLFYNQIQQALLEKEINSIDQRINEINNKTGVTPFEKDQLKGLITRKTNLYKFQEVLNDAYNNILRTKQKDAKQTAKDSAKSQAQEDINRGKSKEEVIKNNQDPNVANDILKAEHNKKVLESLEQATSIKEFQQALAANPEIQNEISDLYRKRISELSKNRTLKSTEDFEGRYGQENELLKEHEQEHIFKNFRERLQNNPNFTEQVENFEKKVQNPEHEFDIDPEFEHLGKHILSGGTVETYFTPENRTNRNDPALREAIDIYNGTHVEKTLSDPDSVQTYDETKEKIKELLQNVKVLDDLLPIYAFLDELLQNTKLSNKQKGHLRGMLTRRNHQLKKEQEHKGSQSPGELSEEGELVEQGDVQSGTTIYPDTKHKNLTLEEAVLLKELGYESIEEYSEEELQNIILNKIKKPEVHHIDSQSLIVTPMIIDRNSSNSSGVKDKFSHRDILVILPDGSFESIEGVPHTAIKDFWHSNTVDKLSTILEDYRHDNLRGKPFPPGTAFKYQQNVGFYNKDAQAHANAIRLLTAAVPGDPIYYEAYVSSKSRSVDSYIIEVVLYEENGKIVKYSPKAKRHVVGLVRSGTNPLIQKGDIALRGLLFDRAKKRAENKKYRVKTKIKGIRFQKNIVVGKKRSITRAEVLDNKFDTVIVNWEDSDDLENYRWSSNGVFSAGETRSNNGEGSIGKFSKRHLGKVFMFIPGYTADGMIDNIPVELDVLMLKDIPRLQHEVFRILSEIEAGTMNPFELESFVRDSWAQIVLGNNEEKSDGIIRVRTIESTFDTSSVVGKTNPLGGLGPLILYSPKDRKKNGKIFKKGFTISTKSGERLEGLTAEEAANVLGTVRIHIPHSGAGNILNQFPEIATTDLDEQDLKINPAPFLEFPEDISEVRDSVEVTKTEITEGVKEKEKDDLKSDIFIDETGPIRFSTYGTNVEEQFSEKEQQEKIQEAVDWIRQVMSSANVALVDELIDGLYNGSYNTIDDLITLSEKFANKKTAKHEIFHKAFNLLSQKEKERLLNEASKLFNIPRKKADPSTGQSASDTAIEEKMAKMMENTPDEKLPKTILGKWIQSVRNFFRNLFSEKTRLQQFMRDINQGRFNKPRTNLQQRFKELYKTFPNIDFISSTLFVSSPQKSAQQKEYLDNDIYNAAAKTLFGNIVVDQLSNKQRWALAYLKHAGISPTKFTTEEELYSHINNEIDRLYREVNTEKKHIIQEFTKKDALDLAESFRNTGDNNNRMAFERLAENDNERKDFTLQRQETQIEDFNTQFLHLKDENISDGLLYIVLNKILKNNYRIQTYIEIEGKRGLLNNYKKQLKIAGKTATEIEKIVEKASNNGQIFKRYESFKRNVNTTNSFYEVPIGSLLDIINDGWNKSDVIGYLHEIEIAKPSDVDLADMKQYQIKELSDGAKLYKIPANSKNGATAIQAYSVEAGKHMDSMPWCTSGKSKATDVNKQDVFVVLSREGTPLIQITYLQNGDIEQLGGIGTNQSIRPEDAKYISEISNVIPNIQQEANRIKRDALVNLFESHQDNETLPAGVSKEDALWFLNSAPKGDKYNSTNPYYKKQRDRFNNKAFIGLITGYPQEKIFVGDLRGLDVGKYLYVDGSVYLGGTTIPEGFTMPTHVGGYVDLRSAAIPKGFTMPTHVGGKVDLKGAAIPEGFTMPTHVGGYVDLEGTTIPEGFAMPTHVGGIYLSGTTIPKGFTMPTHVGGYVDLKGAAIPEGFTMPTHVDGHVDLKGTTIPEGFAMPTHVGGIYLSGATIPKGGILVIRGSIIAGEKITESNQTFTVIEREDMPKYISPIARVDKDASEESHTIDSNISPAPNDYIITNLPTPDFKIEKTKSKEYTEDAANNFLKQRLEEFNVVVSDEALEHLRQMFEVGGGKIWGAVHRAMIYLASDAGVKIKKHEAFHIVFNAFLDVKQQELVAKEAFARWGKDLGISEEQFTKDLHHMFYPDNVASENTLNNIGFYSRERFFNSTSGYMPWDVIFHYTLNEIFNHGQVVEILSFYLHNLSRGVSLEALGNELQLRYGIDFPHVREARVIDAMLSSDILRELFRNFNETFNTQKEEVAAYATKKLDEFKLELGKKYTFGELLTKLPHKLSKKQKLLRDLIYPIIKNLNIPISIYVSDRLDPTYDSVSKELSDGSIVMDIGEVFLNAEMFITMDTEEIFAVLFHEFIHAITIKIINKVRKQDYSGLTDMQIKAVERLEVLYKEMTSTWGNVSQYAVSDIYEFIAHVASDDLIKILEPRDSVLQAVKDFINDTLDAFFRLFNLPAYPFKAKEHAQLLKIIKDIYGDGRYLAQTGFTVTGRLAQIKSGKYQKRDIVPLTVTQIEDESKKSFYEKQSSVTQLLEKVADEYENFSTDAMGFVSESFAQKHPSIAKFFNALYKFIYDKYQRINAWLRDPQTIQDIFYQLDKNYLGRTLSGKRKNNVAKNIMRYKSKAETDNTPVPDFKIRGLTGLQIKKYTDFISTIVFKQMIYNFKAENNVPKYTSYNAIPKKNRAEFRNYFINNLETFVAKILEAGDRINNPNTQAAKANILDALKNERTKFLRYILFEINQRHNVGYYIQEAEDEIEETEKNNIIKNTNIDPTTTVKGRLREWLSYVPMRKHDGTKFVPSFDEELLTPKYYTFDNIVKILLNEFSNSGTPVIFYKKILDAAASSGWADTILETIRAELAEKKLELTPYSAQTSKLFRALYHSFGGKRNIVNLVSYETPIREGVRVTTYELGKKKYIEETFSDGLSIWETGLKNITTAEHLVQLLPQATNELLSANQIYEYYNALGIRISLESATSIANKDYHNSAVKQYLKRHIIALQKNNNPFAFIKTDKDNNPAGKVTMKLIRVLAENNPEGMSLNNKTVLGENKYVHQNNNFLTNTIDRLKNEPNTFYKYFRHFLLHRFADIYWMFAHNKGAYVAEDAGFIRSGENGKEYFEYSPRDIIIHNLNMFLEQRRKLGEDEKTYDLFPLPVFGDAITSYYARVPKNMPSMLSITKLVIGELERIIYSTNTKTGYSAFDQNGPHFILFPFLEEHKEKLINLFNENTIDEHLNKSFQAPGTVGIFGTHFSNLVHRLVTNYIESNVANYIDNLYKKRIISNRLLKFSELSETEQKNIKKYINEILKQEHSEKSKTEQIDIANELLQNILSKYTKITSTELDNSLMTDAIMSPEQIIKEYYFKRYYWNLQFTLLVAQDPAFYGGASKKGFNLLGLITDLGKRFKEGHSPKEDVILTQLNGLPKKELTCLYIEDIFDTSDEALWKELNDISENVWEQNTKHNLTDGQSINNMEFTAEVLYSYGEIEDGAASAEDIENLRNGKFSKQIFDVLKPFYYGVEENGFHKILVPLQYKTSEYTPTPLTAWRTKDGSIKVPTKNQNWNEYRFPKIAKILWVLEGAGDKNRKIDSIRFRSAIKTDIDASKIININDIYDLNFDKIYGAVVAVPTEYYGRQNAVPIEKHINKKLKAGTQLRELALADLDPNEKFILHDKKISGKELRELFDKLLVLNIEEQLRKIGARVKTEADIVKLLLEQEINRGRNIDAVFALDAHPEDGRPIMPLASPIQSNNSQKGLNSFYKQAVAYSGPGATFVNASSVGYHEDLEIVRHYDSNGKPIGIDYVEVGIPAYNNALMFLADKNGFLDIENISERFGKDVVDKMLEGIAYRIPTEGKYSIYRIKLKIITDPTSDATIFLPIEATTISGLDFDVDKLFTLLRAFDISFKDYSPVMSMINDYLQNIDFIDPDNKKTVQVTENEAKQIFKKVMNSQQPQSALETVVFKFLSDNLAELKKSISVLSITYISPALETSLARHNLMLDIFVSVARSKSFAQSFLRGGNSNILDEQIAYLRRAGMLQESKNVDFASPEYQDLFAARATIGARVIAISASHNKNHAAIQRLGAYDLTPITPFIFLDGKIYTSFVGLRTSENELISETLSAILFASTEHLKNPKLDVLKISDNNVGFLLTALRLKVPFKDISLFLYHPVVQEIFEQIELQKIQTHRDLLELLKEMYKNAGGNAKKILEQFSYRIDKSDLLHRDIDKLSVQQYGAILAKFYFLYGISQELLTISSAMRGDKEGFFGPLVYDNLEKLMLVDAIGKKARKDKFYFISGANNVVPEVVLYDNTYTLLPSKLPLNDAYLSIITNQLNDLRYIYPFLGGTFSDIEDSLANILNMDSATFDHKTLVKIHTGATLAYIQNTLSFTPEWINGVAKKIQQIIVENVKNKNVSNIYEKYKLLFSNVGIISQNDQILIGRPKFGKILPEEERQLKAVFEEMMQDPHPETRLLAEQFAAYLYLSTNLIFTKNSFFNIVPTYWWESTEYGKNFRNLYHGLANLRSALEAIANTPFELERVIQQISLYILYNNPTMSRYAVPKDFIVKRSEKFSVQYFDDVHTIDVPFVLGVKKDAQSKYTYSAESGSESVDLPLNYIHQVFTINKEKVPMLYKYDSSTELYVAVRLISNPNGTHIYTNTTESWHPFMKNYHAIISGIIPENTSPNKLTTDTLKEMTYPTISTFEAKYASAGAKKSGYDKKDTKKFNNRINKLISRGSEGSSSRGYQQEFEENGWPVNEKDGYRPTDVVGISAEGNRTNRIVPDFVLIDIAAKANVTFVTDPKPSDYNIGEKEVHEHLFSLGYVNNGSGIWTKPEITETKLSADNLKAAIKEANSRSPIEQNLFDGYRPNLTDKRTWARTAENSYEVSSAGDKRFSARFAQLKDGRYIEDIYQLDIKGNGIAVSKPLTDKQNPVETTIKKTGKFTRNVSEEQSWKEYKELWRQYLLENPDLHMELIKNTQDKVLTDSFANTNVSQARALAELLNEMGNIAKKHTIRKTITDIYRAGISTFALVKLKIRTRTTRSASWMKANNPKVGDYFWQISKKNPKDRVLTRITAVYDKNDPRFIDNWYKEGWIEENIEYINDLSHAVEFEVIDAKQTSAIESEHRAKKQSVDGTIFAVPGDIIMVDGQYITIPPAKTLAYTEAGEETSIETLNKGLIKLENEAKTLRIYTFENNTYWVLSNNKIIDSKTFLEAQISDAAQKTILKEAKKKCYGV